MNKSQQADREGGLVILGLFMLIIIGLAIAAFLFVIQKQRQNHGGKTQINIQSTINL